MRFKGKSAVITGSASGMGAATSRHFADQGGLAILIDINDALSGVGRGRSSESSFEDF